MGADLSLILKLQSMDLRALDLEREISSLPKHIAEIEKQLDSHRRRLEIDRTALAANQKERKSLETDIQSQDQKISKLKDQMLQAKTNEQYRAFQHEIDYCQEQIRKCEDRILELMSESEPLAENVKKAEGALAEESKQVEGEKKTARERTAVDQQQLATIKTERGVIVNDVRKDFYANYERIRQRSKGIALAEAAEGRCMACQMLIRPQIMQELRQGLESLSFCENCKRILYYNPPVNVEEQMA